MRRIRAAGVVLLVVALAATLLTANAAIAAERTVLTDEFVTSTMAEEDAYAAIGDGIAEQAASSIDAGGAANETGGGPGGLPLSQAALVDAAVTEEYVAGQVERNVEATYAYLHGRRSAVTIGLNTTPVRENLADAVATEIKDASLAELLSPVAGSDGELSMGGVAIDTAVFDDLAESRASYRAAQADFRERVRGAVLNRAVDRAFDSASNDELLGLVIDDYDPDEYTASEKARMVDEREAAIRTALRDRIESERGDEIDRRVDERLDALPETVRAGADDAADGLPPALAEPFSELAVVGAEGLSGQVSYDAYTSRLASAKQDLAENASALVRSQLSSEMPARVTVASSSDPGTGGALSRARRVVRFVDALSVALPVLALLLVGGLWRLTRSGPVTAAGTGVGLLAGGLPGYALASVLPDRIAAALDRTGAPPMVGDVVVGLVERSASVVAGQSLVLVVAGGVLLVIAAYVHAYGSPAWARHVRVT